ncbi:hypothetical protein [Reyranella sp.]|uniref:hypothetical protein n=1 Tax=Reyranella sp. TaxID=1929291 RepID=UPI003D0A2D09
MKATLRPKRDSPTAEYAPVELIARTGNRRITIRCAGNRIYAVDRFRLHDARARQRLTEADFARLPWQGKGPDPETQP